MKRLLKIIFFLLIAFYVAIFISLLTSIRAYVLIEIFTGLPLVFPITIMYYCAVDMFTPNPKYDNIYGWIYAEFLEHFVLPLTLVISLLTIPILFPLISMFLIMYFYGSVLGVVKIMMDYVKIVLLMLSFAFLLWFPDITLYINLITNFGWLYIIFITLSSTVLYFIVKLTRTKKNSLDMIPLTQFLKGYFMILLGVLASLFVLLV